MLAMGQPVRAQTGFTWAADASIGVADQRGGEFLASSAPAARLAVSARKGLRRGIGVDAEFAYDWLGPASGGSGRPCRLDSRGFCMPDFPNIAGPAGLIGVSFGDGNVDVRANAGMAAYRVDSRGAAGDIARLGAPLTEIDVALAPVSWFALVGGGRAFVLPNLHGDRVWIATLHLGVRLRSRRPS
jgi:hypothetical protein